MNRQKLFSFVTVTGLALALAAITIAADPPKQEGGTPPPLPAGWTEADMKAMVEAGTPGKMHKFLADSAGTWAGKNTMWPAPGAPPIQSESTSVVKPLMDGRYIQLEVKGEMPGVGPYQGMGTYGFDNVTQKFVSSWIDNMSTGMMQGTGELSPDGKTLTWQYSHSCPITKKPVAVREIEKITGPDTRTIEMHGTDPKSGKEYKMMMIELTKKS